MPLYLIERRFAEQLDLSGEDVDLIEAANAAEGVRWLFSFLTADLLGGAKQLMIGNLIQNQFSAARNWPFGSAASFIIMALVLTAVMLYLRMKDPVGLESR